MDIKDLDNLIKDRRATPPQFYNGDDVPDEYIYRILENANWAPTHKETEPWRFIVYKGKHKDKLAEEVFNFVMSEYKNNEQVDPAKAEKFRKNTLNSGAVIAIILQRDPEEQVPEWEEIAAVACGVQNMWLTATALKIKAFWSTPKFKSLLGDILELKPGQRSLGFFFLGQSAMDYPGPGRGDVKEKIRWAG